MRKEARRATRFLAARRRPAEKGLTLIELLLSVVLLAVLTGFLAGGLSLARHGFQADQSGETASATYTTVQTLASLIGSAMPVQSAATRVPGGVFDGQEEGLSFVGLSEGRGLQGGLHRIVLRRIGRDLVADFRSLAVRPSAFGDPANVSVLTDVRDIRFRYFGSLVPSEAPRWHDEWGHSDRAPELVSIQVEFQNVPQDEPITVITALRQE